MTNFSDDVLPPSSNMASHVKTLKTSSDIKFLFYSVARRKPFLQLSKNVYSLGLREYSGINRLNSFKLPFSVESQDSILKVIITFVGLVTEAVCNFVHQYGKIIPDQFLGVFAKLRKATISFMSVCPSVRMEQQLPLGGA
jgi:hypothetical protein